MLTEPDTERHMLPRWRTFNDALALGELRPHKESPPEASLTITYVEKKLALWKEHQTLSYAIELTEAALFSSEPSLAADAAKYIKDYKPGASQSAMLLADVLLAQHEGKRISSELMEPQIPDDSIIRHRIAFLKGRTIINPRNPFAWADIAFYYGIQGLIEKAQKSLLVALSFSPESRLITRSLARLYTHSGDHDLALNLIRSRERFISDPWLLAAEIAVADLGGQNSKSIKVGREFLAGQKFHPFHLSELSSAIASIEIKSGASKVARKHFRFSMEAPTENSCAQFEWAIKNKIIPRPDGFYCKAAGNYEANSYTSYSAGDWESSVESAWKWCIDQPFSIESSSWGSYVASVATCNYDMAIQMSRFGLKANPDSWVLKNNLAFSLAKSRRAEEALVVLNGISPPRDDKNALATISATCGLVCFRHGEIKEGREYYQRAIDYFDKVRDKRAAFMAKSFLTIEEIRLKSERVETLLMEIESEKKQLITLPEFEVVFKELGRELKDNKIDRNLFLK
jgi:tetratricopeptide (TPR) repeat protein